VASDISEAISLDLPPPPRRPAMGSLAAQPVPQPARPVMGPLQGAGGEVADLVRCLAGTQANDSGWPTFNGKYEEYPRFRKVWWAYRQTYHGHVKEELACRNFKERSLASSVWILVNDIEDLREAWDTLDMCFDRLERYILGPWSPSSSLKLQGLR
jgi:hypothetical protein